MSKLDKLPSAYQGLSAEEQTKKIFTSLSEDAMPRIAHNVARYYGARIGF